MGLLSVKPRTRPRQQNVEWKREGQPARGQATPRSDVRISRTGLSVLSDYRDASLAPMCSETSWEVQMAQAAAKSSSPIESEARKIVSRTRGHTHGPITRLMSPSD